VSQDWNLQLALEEMNVIAFIELELIISMLNIAHADPKMAVILAEDLLLPIG